MAIVVEFVGLPGVGKTTVSTVVANELRKQGFTAREPTRRLGEYSGPRRVATKSRFALKEVLRNPRTATTTVQKVATSAQPSIKDAIRTLFNLVYIRGLLCAHVNSRETVLFDQGPYQAVWSIGLRSGRAWPELLDSFLGFEDQVQPDLIVLVTASEETIRDRLRSRTGEDSRLERDEQHFHRAVDGYKQLSERLENNAQTPPTVTVVNETRDDFQKNVTRVAEEILTVQQS